LAFKAQKEMFGQCSIAKLEEIEGIQLRLIKAEESNLLKRIERRRQETAEKEMILMSKIDRLPPTCTRTDQAVQPGDFRDLFQNREAQEDVYPDITEWAAFRVEIVQGARSRQGSWRSPQDGAKVDPTQLSARRGPPTDRPPDKPPSCKGASRGCLQERAGTRHASQLASFTRGSYSLSGNATPLQTMQIKVCAPSNYSASHAAGGSSQNSSTRLASRAGGLRGVAGSGQTDTCVAQGNPSKT
jgi:hypothetical protein